MRGKHDHETHAELKAEVARLKAAIRAHRDTEGDDRCREDDDVLYAALGEPIPDRPLPPRCEMLESCRRYIDQRHRGFKGTSDKRHGLEPEEMTIAQLQAEVHSQNRLHKAAAIVMHTMEKIKGDVIHMGKQLEALHHAPQCFHSYAQDNMADRGLPIAGTADEHGVGVGPSPE